MDDMDTVDKRRECNRSFGHGHDSFQPLPPECTLVTVGRPMAPPQLEQLAALIQGRPEVMLHFHTWPAHDLEFLKYFPFVRRLSVHLYGLEDITGFSYLQGGLEHLSFGKTKKRISLAFLADMLALQTLYLESHTKDIASVSRLSRLTSLGFRSITLPDLSLLTPLRELTTFSLLLGGTTDLTHLAELPKLEVFSLMRVNKLADLSILARLESLRTLDMDWMRNVMSLPSLAPLTRLEDVTLETMKGLTGISAVAAAPALRRLTIAGMPQLDVEAFRCLIGHPHLVELRLHSSLGGVNLKKPVLEAVRRLLPGIVRP
jgi:hypothetical protein